MSKALLVIDMLNDFLDKEGVLYIGPSAEEVKKNVAEKVNDRRNNGVPIIYIMDRHLENDAEFNMFPPHCLAGKWGSEIVPEIAPQRGEYLIYKRRFSAFFGTDLDLTLRELGVSTLEITGVCTQICVLYTAADARMRHYDVVVSENCVASFDDEAHRFSIQQMEKTLGVKVLKGEDV